MIKELIDEILTLAYKHVSVGSVRYDREININDFHGNKGFQVIVESDSSLLEKQVVEGIITLTLSMDILGFVGKNKVIEVQDEALHIGLDIMQYIQDNMYHMEIRDYSFLSLTEYSDDNSSGVRITLKLAVPSPINICMYEDNFIEKQEEEEQAIDLTNGDECTNSKFVEEGTELKLKPIRLK